MRDAVTAQVASLAHARAAEAVVVDHLPGFERSMGRMMRRFTREAVARFLRLHPVIGAAAEPNPLPSFHVPIPSQLLDDDAAQAELEESAKRFTVSAAQAAGLMVSAELGLGFDVTNRLLRGVIASQSGMRITTAPADLIRTMMGSLQKSYDEGASIPRAARDMRAVGYEHSKMYAERIARTELIGAVNESSLAMVSGGTDLPYKQWIATADDRTRPSHAELDGETIPIDDVFDNGCAFPGDPEGEAEEVINCRCTLGYAEEANVNTIAGGAAMAAVDTATTEDEVRVGATWGGPIAQEGVDTGDGRRIEPGALSWRELPLTLMAQHTTPEWGGHAEAAVAGRIDVITRNGENMDGTGIFDTGSWGAETERMVRENILNGISIDLSVDEAEVIPDPEIEDPEEAYWMGTLNILKGTILGATIVPFPAFENAKIAIVAAGSRRLHNLRIVDGRKVITLTMPFAAEFADPPQGESPEGDQEEEGDDTGDAAEAIADIREAVNGWPGLDGEVVVTIDGQATTITFPPAGSDAEEPGEDDAVTAAAISHVDALRALLRGKR